MEVVSVDTLGRGQGLGQLLRAHGLAGNDFVGLLDRLREFESPRRLQPGVAVRFAARVPGTTDRVVLDLDRDRSLHMVRRDGGWTARLDSVPVRVDTIRIGGVIESSLWNARLSGDTHRLAENEDNDLLDRLTQIYAWQVDFFRDIRSGDAFRVLIEREVRPDGSVRRGRVLAAEFFNDGRRLPAVRFDVPDAPVEYYDAEGEATRKAFLRAPLEFGRRTSGFSRRRYHPVLRRYRAHRGVDYGAPRGTPVLATGAGVVTKARWWGGYGRVVEIRHNSRHRTRYAHLRSFARGIRPGVRVEQKEVIGYVGASGLATGSHVHYEFLVNGRQRNPSTVDLPPGDPVPREHREEYRRVRDRRLSLLRELALPSSVRVVREGGSGGGAAAD
jgi:murein DD-endopeptidase MepM/ murein hydrolase activator NlpD